MPVLTNLFGTVERVAMGMGEESILALREVGKLLAALKEPEPPKGLKDAFHKLPLLKQAMNMAPKYVSKAAVSNPCLGKRRGGFNPVAHTNLLAQRRGSVNYLGHGHHQRTESST